MLETLLGGIFGGVLRLAPEVLKLLDKKDERKHELSMLEKEMEFAKTKAEAYLRESEVQLAGTQLETLAAAFREQSETAQAAGPIASTVSALVRPLSTYIFLALFAMVKVATYTLAVSQGGNWAQVLTGMWGVDDMAAFNMVLGFWFVGRVYERKFN